MHGPLRTWPFELIDEHIDGDAVTVQLQTTITPDQHGVVAPCQVTVAHRFAPGRLTVMWATTNLGSLPQPSAGALHTYLAADARQAVISGFDGCHWVGPDDSDEQGTVEGVISHPVGRTMTMRDGSGIELRSAGTTCAMRQDGARCTVVWNPGPGHGIADLAEDETDAFICIEASNKGDERVIAPGTTHDVQVDYCFS